MHMKVKNNCDLDIFTHIAFTSTVRGSGDHLFSFKVWRGRPPGALAGTGGKSGLQ